MSELDPYSAHQYEQAREDDYAIERMKAQLDDIRQETADMLMAARDPRYSDNFRQLCRNRVAVNRKEAARLIAEIRGME